MAGAGGGIQVGVVCDDRPECRHVVGQLLDACGFQPDGEAADFLALRELVQRLQPAVVVVTLPLPGMNGLRAVRALREDAPGCQVVLLSEFGQLDIAAVEAGAAALVPEQDLRALKLVLLGIAERAAAIVVPEARIQVEDVATTVVL